MVAKWTAWQPPKKIVDTKEGVFGLDHELGCAMSTVTKDVLIKRVINKTPPFAFGSYEGSDVYISAQVYEDLAAPEEGDFIPMLIKRNAKKTGQWEAVRSSTLFGVHWEDWQHGKHQLQLPNTKPGSSHDDLTFACFRCKDVIISDCDDIWKIKDGYIWTKKIPSTVKEGSKFFNKYKKINNYGCACANEACRTSLGKIIKDPYEDEEDPGKPIPTASLIHYRIKEMEEDPNGCLNSLVLLASSKEDAERMIGNLDKIGEGGAKMTPQMFDQRQQQMEADRGGRKYS